MTAGRTHPAVWLAPASILLLALAPWWPYGFFTLLRVVVCGAAAFLAYAEHQAEGRVTGWAVLFVGVALLFNPIAPVHLGRAIWAPIDLATAGLFVAHWRKRGPSL